MLEAILRVKRPRATVFARTGYPQRPASALLFVRSR